MLALCLIFIIILCVNSYSLLSLLGPLAHSFHQACLSHIPLTSKWVPIYSALVCGESLPEGQIKKVFISVGVIHLMVISGAHLIFLEKFWSVLPSFRFKNVFLMGFLLLYSLSSGLRPPVLRALFSVMCTWGVKKLKLFWSPYWKVQISGVLCLLCQNAWVYSLSLQLSWLASTGMANRRFSRLQSCVLTYLLILPIVSRWGGVHPFSICVNWVLAPIASCVLLPLSMLVIVCPFITPFVDGCWTLFINVLQSLQPAMENKGVEIITFSSFQIWVYIWLVFIVFQTYFIYSNRK